MHENKVSAHMTCIARIPAAKIQDIARASETRASEAAAIRTPLLSSAVFSLYNRGNQTEANGPLGSGVVIVFVDIISAAGVVVMAGLANKASTPLPRAR